MQLHTLVSLGLATAVCGAAVGFGDYAARRIGAVAGLAWAGSLLVHGKDAYNIDLALLTIDVAILVYFILVSMRSRRIWTIVVSAFQAIIVASHIATTIDLRVTLGTLYMSMAMWSYGILACIAFGTWTGWRDNRRAIAIAES
ncbi:hypothetical protein BH10PSE4_BH10PSE4_41040 [soil metagenome]